MLKTVVMIFHGNADKALSELEEERRYLADHGLVLETVSGQDIRSVFRLFNRNSDEILFLCDDTDDYQFMKDSGAYVCGMITPVSPEGTGFPGARYIFSEVDDIDADSFVKAWQREAGEPWQVLVTDRLIIRETTVEDVEDLYRIYSDPAMTRYMEGLFENHEDEIRYTRDYIQKVYCLNGFGVWSLILRSTGELIGRAGYSVRNGFDEPELGFLIGVPWQRQGYAREACQAIIDYGHEVLGFDRMQALVKEGNEVSIHLCETLGFKVSDEVEIEEDIYGANYQINGHISLGPSKKGRYVRMQLVLQ